MGGSDLSDGGVLFQAATTAVVLAAAASAASVGVVRRRAVALRLVDVPNERSSHVIPTPRGGGVGILFGLLLGLLAARLAFPESVSRAAAVLVGLALLVGLVGLVDDRGGLPASLRLILHLMAATSLVHLVGPISTLPLPVPLSFALATPFASVLMTVIWVAGITNFFNFMDGVDGLAGGQAVVSCIGIAVAGWSADATVVACAIAGAAAGFLFYNWPPAKIFMGDVGSGAIGFLLAGLPLLAPAQRRSEAVLAVALGLTFFILDPLLTLVRRALSRRPLMQAHREHLYQRLIPAGTSGSRVTQALMAGAGVLALAGAASFRREGFAWAAIACAACLFLVECVLASRASARTCQGSGLKISVDAASTETREG